MGQENGSQLGLAPAVELQTKVPEDYAKFCNNTSRAVFIVKALVG